MFNSELHRHIHSEASTLKRHPNLLIALFVCLPCILLQGLFRLKHQLFFQKSADVRIEDDVLVKDGKAEVLSRCIAKEMPEIEKLFATRGNKF